MSPPSWPFASCFVRNVIQEDPFVDSVAAVSAGVYFDEEVLDLNYQEDKEATVDANIVMTGSGKFIEVQSSGEEATYTEKQLQRLIELGKTGHPSTHRVTEKDAGRLRIGPYGSGHMIR